MSLFGVTGLFQEKPSKDKQWRPEDKMRIEQMEYIEELSDEEAQQSREGLRFPWVANHRQLREGILHNYPNSSKPTLVP